MSHRVQLYVFLVLLGVLALVILNNWGGSAEIVLRFVPEEEYKVLDVDNPRLRLDLLERIRKVEYTGTHRNIFSASAPPPPAPKTPPQPAVVADTPSAPAPPLQVPAKFYGYVANAQSGRRRAFFTNGEDFFIVGEGEIFLSRFRLLRIGTATAEVEEVSTGRRAVLGLDAAPSGPGV